MMASLAEGLNILHNANAGKRVAQADAETAPMEKPEFYRFDIDTAAVAEVWRRGCLAPFTRPGRVRRAGVGLRRGPVDVDRGA
jgi:hypothetical protein